MEQVSAKISPPTRLVCLPGGNQRATATARKPPSQAIQPFQPQDTAALSTITPQDRFQVDLRRLETQAQRVNELTAELESAIWELKAIASQVNQSSGVFREQYGHHWFPAEICEYHSLELPTLRQQENGQLVLASRSLDLFAAEREARELAAMLRQGSSRKRQARKPKAKSAPPPTPEATDSAPPAEPAAPKRRRRKSSTAATSPDSPPPAKTQRKRAPASRKRSTASGRSTRRSKTVGTEVATEA